MTKSERPILGFDPAPNTSTGLAIDPRLEAEYALRRRHPERTAVYEAFAQRSADWRAQWPGFFSHRYLDDDPVAVSATAIDFFPATTTGPAPLLIFIHGGYWRALDRSIFSFLAKPWVARGVHVALPGYQLAPQRNVAQIVQQVRCACACIRRHASDWQIDRTRILVSGHSAGAQLGALCLDPPLAGSALGSSALGFIGISGVYDLLPLLRTSINEDIRLDEPQARAMSPAFHPPPRFDHVLCVAGGAETQGFKVQSQDQALRWRQQGLPADYHEATGRTHFDILDDLADEHAELFKRAWRFLESS